MSAAITPVAGSASGQREKSGPDPSMEEILASIRRIIADESEGAAEEADRSEPLPPEAAYPGPPPLVTQPDQEVGPAAGATVADDPEPSAQSLGSPQLSPEPIAEFMAPPLDPPLHAADPADGPGPRARPTSPDPESILSDEVTASVGQAFHALSHTILSQHARTLEDLVREMLKPMLKAWLDDNLPAIVERLVRAEIERVARGNR